MVTRTPPNQPRRPGQPTDDLDHPSAVVTDPYTLERLATIIKAATQNPNPTTHPS